LTPPLKTHECWEHAADCEKRAAASTDPEVREIYARLALQWRTLAAQVDQIEGRIEKA
jgi:hypothetical protein